METLKKLSAKECKRSNYVELLKDGDIYIIRYKFHSMNKPLESKTSDYEYALLDFMKIALFILSY